jgi:hypothetical protein
MLRPKAIADVAAKKCWDFALEEDESEANNGLTGYAAITSP